MNLARRSIHSVTWTTGSNAFAVVVLLFRMIVLARILPIATFGIYAFAHSVIIITVIFCHMGMHGAFLNRVEETRDELRAASVHFSMMAILSTIWFLLITSCALVFSSGDVTLAFLALGLAYYTKQFTETSRLILTRRVSHRKLAGIEFTQTIFSTIIAVALALAGAGIWALLSISMTITVVTIIGHYVVRPVWKPTLSLEGDVVRYYLRFGSRNVLALLLKHLNQRVDDLWTSFVLGPTALGFYSRAYNFASYPAWILSPPISAVAGGTFAELKSDRTRLSKAFFRTMAYLVRAGFLAAGSLALVAPEFIQFVLGERWMPMLGTFRLMLVYSMLEPVLRLAGRLFVVTGHPTFLIKARATQLAVLAILLFMLLPEAGTEGVAIAVTLMSLTGITILFVRVRAFVDYSMRRMLIPPACALLIAGALSMAVGHTLGLGTNLWLLSATKLTVFLFVYCGCLLWYEREEILEIIRLFRGKAKKISQEPDPVVSPADEA